ncbi:MAG: class I SAM-dependent methyltransferase [Alphaproteobacteria bacterium]|jgi:hypothetical protein|nr:class I SAM-dependent methyltransferase [Alphaproteobacteria bacterium]MDP6814358.1 class I SAM-dependent methyltransferase [Alphaproteobacteria bacterium]
MHRRSLRFGLLTVLGLARQGFFIPYRYADTLPHPGTVPSYPASADRLAESEADFAAFLDVMDGLADAYRAIGDEPPPAPRWTQDWFPTLDAAAAYAMVRQRAPARIVEVGSGHSTRFLQRAVEDGGLATRITAIDPAPKRFAERLDIDFHRATLGQVGLTPFRELAAGDMLFIDSSHILMPGSDVDDLFNRVLPLLPAGTLVHIHDIMLPDDYPHDWDWRGYNEQLTVAVLLSSGAYQPLFASHYVASRMADRLAASVVATLPGKAHAHPASLWLLKK